MEQHRRRLRRAGHPADRPDRSDRCDPAGRTAGRRPDRARCTGRARRRASACWSPTLTKRMAEDLTEYMHEHGIRVPLHALRHRHARSASRSSATCGSARSTCWSASTCCARASTSPNARWWRSSTRTRKASCARRPRWCRPSAAPRATSTAASILVRRQRSPTRCKGAMAGDRPPPREADGLQRGARHHPGIGEAQHRRDPAVDRRARPLRDRHRRVGRRDNWSATICRPISPS